MKGIILAGGSGSRLYPLTKVISKQLLPVYDKPMIYYPLSTLMLSGIKEILIISTPTDISLYERLLNVALVLGDNIFYGSGFSEILMKSVKTVSEENKAVVFGYEVKDPSRYGVVEFNENNEVVSVEEKPTQPKSNYAIVGLYYYTNDVIEIAKNVKPSKRGELEITSVNNVYLDQENLNVEFMGRGFAWLDTGTIDAINNASNFIRTIEERQGLKVACLEEIAYYNNFIDKIQLEHIIKKLPNDYANYLCRLIDN